MKQVIKTIHHNPLRFGVIVFIVGISVFILFNKKNKEKPAVNTPASTTEEFQASQPEKTPQVTMEKEQIVRPLDEKEQPVTLKNPAVSTFSQVLYDANKEVSPSLSIAGADDFTFVKVYYYNEKKDMDENGQVMATPNGVVPVNRKIQKSKNLIVQALQSVLTGALSKTEKEAGFKTEYPLDGFSIEKIVLQANGELWITFNDPKGQTLGGSTRVSILAEQIRRTGLQFEEVKKVFFEPETIFQP